MIEVSIPGHKNLCLEYLVLDYNGTLAFDGQPLAGVKKAMRILAERLQIHVVTADTFGKAKRELEGVPCRLSILSSENQDTAKSQYVRALGPKSSVCIGNGRNDKQMLKEAALGIAVVQEEATAVETLLAADIVCPSVICALELLVNPKRLVATLRS